MRLRNAIGTALAAMAVISQAAWADNDNGRGRHKQLYALPTPGKVVIDGKLDDWDLSGQIEMFVIQATRGTMNAKFAVMYDAEAIYLGADVNDPNPMMNMRGPSTDPFHAWNADSCQFRLTVDPVVGYPILDESTFKYGGANAPKDTRDDIVHLTLWHYTESGEPQLAMTQGMTYRVPPNAPRGLVPQEQFRANYIKRGDGTGYSFEYRIYDATHVATDGATVFTAGGHGFHPSIHTIKYMTLNEARPIQVGGKEHIDAPPGGDDKRNTITGLACDGQVLCASYKARNLIARFNPKTGALLGTVEVPAPERLAVLPDGRIAVLSAGKVLVLKDGKAEVTIADKLDEPTAVAAFDGMLFVANRGKLMNVSVFDLGGKYLRSIGKQGGRPAIGKYDALGIYMPGGITVDKTGQLWVAETTDAPKRISVWDAKTGAFKKEFFGGSDYFAYGFIDPAKPDEVLVHNVLWKIDWKNYKVAPLTTVWRKTSPEMIPPLGAGSYSASPKIITAANGRQYMYGQNYAHFSGLFYRDGDLFKPTISKIHVGYDYIGPAGIPFMDNDRPKYPQGHYLWQDQNGDCCVQAEEVTSLKGTPFDGYVVSWVFPDLTVLANGRLLKPVSMENGIPKYDLTKSEPYAPPFGYSAVPSEDGGSFSYTPAKGVSLARYDKAGNPLWSYSDIIDWRGSLNLGVTGPGKLWGMTQCMGKGGDFLVFQVYFGPNHVFRADGMYVGALLKDGRLMINRGQDEGQPEGQGGYFGKLNIDGQQRYFAIGGGQDARVWEVVGLDTIKDLPGGTYVHTPELAAKAEQAQREYRLAMAAASQIVIGKDLAAAKTVEKELEAGRAFKVKVARDGKSLLVEYEVNSDTALVNATPDPKLLFKGGNCLDIQLENSRGEAVRVLVTQYQGKPFATVYFPKVKDFKGEPTVFNSPTGKESFDEILFLDNIALTVEKTSKGFRAQATLPLAALRLDLKPGQKLKMDLGYIHSGRLARMLTAQTAWDARWEKHLKAESFEPCFTPAYGLVLNADELAALRERHAALTADGNPSPFVAAAKLAVRIPPERLIREFVNFWGDSRYNRERDHDKFILNHGLNAAIAGHLLRDKRLLRLAARCAMSIGMCRNWDDGFICRFPGGNFDHRCFVQSLCAWEVASILDLAGECFTDTGRDYLLRRLAEEAIGAIQFNAWKYDYIFGCNQLAWFTPGRMLALAVLHRHWPRVRPYLDIAYRELCESLERSILPDGGYVEGPMYFRCVGRDAGLGVYLYSRALGQPMAELMPGAMRRCGGFAEALISTDTTSDVVPICDAGNRHEVISQAMMASMLPHSAWTRMLRKTVDRNQGWPVNDWSKALSAPAMADAAIAWGLIAQMPSEVPEPPAFVHLPSMGPIVSQRRLAGEWVKLFIQGNQTGAGHTHEDKGSFVLEFAGETFAIDPGTCDYSHPLAGVLKNCERHNMLVPYGMAERPHPACPLPYDVKATGTGDAIAFHAEIDATPGWDGYYRRWLRKWNSPTPEVLTITDEYELLTGEGVGYLWQTRLPVTVNGRHAVITGTHGRVELEAPEGCAWRLEELPLLDGVQQRLAVNMPGLAGVLAIHVRLAGTA